METRNEQSIHQARGHESGHRHGDGCGHTPVKHGDHSDYVVEGRVHHEHQDHCDDRGPS
jgi:hypothetical protein